MTGPSSQCNEGGKKDSEIRDNWGILAINQRENGRKLKVGQVHTGSVVWLLREVCSCKYVSDPQAVAEGGHLTHGGSPSGCTHSRVSMT